MDTPKVTKSDKRLGELLRMEGLVNDEQIASALMRQQVENELLGESMVRLGFVTERDVARVIAKQYSLPFIDVASHLVNKEAFENFPTALFAKYQIAPLDKIGDAVTFATCGPITPEMVEELRNVTGCDVYLFVGTVSDVHQAIHDYTDTTPSEDHKTQRDGKLQQTAEEHTGQE